MMFRSIRYRFSISLAANIARAGISFLTGLIVARALGPSGFGNLAFLLGSFTAIRAFLDLGSSSAFFTLFSQRPRGQKFAYSYLLWQVIQLLLMILLIDLILPARIFDLVWLGQERGVVVLALLASFFQHQIWQTFSQIGDAVRQSHVVQIIGVLVVLTHFFIVLVLWEMHILGLPSLLGIIGVEYFIASFVVWRKLFFLIDKNILMPKISLLIKEYWTYCAPLIAASFFGFIYTFFDNWLLHQFGGARQQGFYAVASQFSAIGMLLTVAITQIAWKEIAEAHAHGDFNKVRKLYKKVSRMLFGVSTIVAGALIPWAKEIIMMTLGLDYLESSSIFMLMLFYPIYQTAGQILTTMLSATANTRIQMMIGIISSLISLPLSYFILAPKDAMVPGFELGAFGAAIKLIIFTIVTVNFTEWWFCKKNKWVYDWINQIKVIMYITLASSLSYGITWVSMSFFKIELFLQVILFLVTYLIIIFGVIGKLPDILGFSRGDLPPKFHLQ